MFNIQIHETNFGGNSATFGVSDLLALPAVPIPSTDLRKLMSLYDYKFTNFESGNISPINDPQLTNSKKRKINGFIAFRSYYTKSVKGSRQQKELSSKLAKLWPKEASHEVWHCYALRYNATGGGVAFNSWLHDRLCSARNERKRFKVHKVTNTNVEDVFVESND